MKRLLSLLWNWSWLITLPIVIGFGYWGVASYRQFRTFGVDFDASPIKVRLRDVGADQARLLLRSLRLSFWPPGNGPAVAGQTLRSIQLFVPERELNKLNGNLPHSGFSYVDASIWDDGELKEVRIKYRGDFLPHWGFAKKSIRVKTKKTDLFEGMRAFNLIAPKYPEQLNNYLGYRLAMRLGLVAPRNQLVNVVINGKLQGMHVLTEQLDEGTLRHHDRMPGDLYSGELIGRDQWSSTTNRVLELPHLWDKVAANNHFDLESRAPLERLIRLLNQLPDEAGQTELSELLDMERWGRFAAFELLTQTHHYDEFHNWRLYYDPWRTCFEPVIWDPIAWIRETRPTNPDDGIHLDLTSTRLHQWLLSNGDFLRARHAALVEFFNSGKDRAFLLEVDNAIAGARNALVRDPRIRPTDPARIAAGLTSFRAFIDRVFSELSAAYLEEVGGLRYVAPDGDGVIALQVSHRRPVEELELRYVQPVAGPVTAKLRYLQEGIRKEIDLSGSVWLQGNTVRVSATLLAQLAPLFRSQRTVVRTHRKKLRPTYYELCIGNVPQTNPLLEILTRYNGATERAEEVAALRPAPIRFLHRIVAASSRTGALMWRGDIDITGVREVREDLVLEPGTTVRLAPGAGLILRGRLLARGREDAPIRFIPATAGQSAWGAIALKGRAADGSRLEHCQFRKGSGLKQPLAEYSAMFSVHDVRDVEVTDCSFHDSKIVDDMVHTVYATIHFERCTFERALFDAVDLDISEGTMANCRFVGSGNDAIDLMTTKFAVRDTVFLDSGDKGISIGEGSTLLAVNVAFRGCNIGTQAKDGSRAVIYNAEFASNNLAMDAYKKNWRYDAGGLLRVAKARLIDNPNTVTADKHSRIELVDCYVDGKIAEVADRIVLEDVDAERRRRAKRRRRDPFPEQFEGPDSRARSIWAGIDPTVRGMQNQGSKDR